MSADAAKSRVLIIAIALAVGAPVLGADSKVTLNGDQEVPPVNTPATATGTISVDADKSISGSITTSGIVGTMAHIHEGPTGKNGGVAVPLTKTAENVWSIPPNTKLSDAQYASYKAGDLYVNVHSAEHKGGEIRAQIKP